MIPSDIGFSVLQLLAPEPEPAPLSSEIGYASATLQGFIPQWITLAVLQDERCFVTARYAGQKVRLGDVVYEAQRDNEEIGLFGSGPFQIGEGWWGGPISVVGGDFTGPSFSGDTPPFRYEGEIVSPKWDGPENNSTSSFDIFEVISWEPSADWDSPGARRYSAGVDRGMLYVDGVGYSWSGLISVSQKNDGSEVSKHHLDGVVFRNTAYPGSLVADLEAYTYPDQFDACIGNDFLRDADFVPSGLTVHHQFGKPFDLCYRTWDGDGNGRDQEYTLHFAYNLVAVDPGRKSETFTDSIDMETFGFELHGTPVRVPGTRPSSYFSISTRNVPHGLVQGLEKVLYGTDGAISRLPSPEEIRDYLIG